MDQTDILDSQTNGDEDYRKDSTIQPPSYESATYEPTTGDDHGGDDSKEPNQNTHDSEMLVNVDSKGVSGDEITYEISADEPKSWNLDETGPDNKPRWRRRTQEELDVSFEANTFPNPTTQLSPTQDTSELLYDDEPLLPPVPPQTPQIDDLEGLTAEHGPFHIVYGPEQPIRPVDQLEWPKEKTVLVTTYKNDYPPRLNNRRQDPILPKSSLSNPKHAEPLQTTYKTDYISRPIERLEPILPKPLLGQSMEPMQEITSYRLDFPPRVGQKRDGIKPPQNLAISSDPMERYTSHMIEYPPRDFIPRSKPFRPTCQPSFLAGVSTGISAYREEFITPDLMPFHSWKPNCKYIPPTLPMESQTVYRTAFGSMNPIATENFAPKCIYQPPTEPISDRTSYRIDFSPPPPVQTISFKPRLVYRHEPKNGLAQTSTQNLSGRQYSQPWGQTARLNSVSYANYQPPVGSYRDNMDGFSNGGMKISLNSSWTGTKQQKKEISWNLSANNYSDRQDQSLSKRLSKSMTGLSAQSPISASMGKAVTKIMKALDSKPLISLPKLTSR
ncbi:unnamed protein product [Echinostoma caproni]|uniref:ZM domain-containing protein n=1 Tax=Echinostoma caproni TaxID=27848 RepID=A0A183A6N2_9TREM|nr:unnamed protein product [Echinostoma caproni]